MHEFFHDEDEVGMVQILPMEWWDYCMAEFAALAEHDRQFRAPDGPGWTRLYRHREPEPSLPRIQMRQTRFIGLLQPHARQFDRIVSPLSEVDASLGIRAVGFGPSSRLGIIADLEDDSVRSIWCSLSTTDDGCRRVLAEMLSALGADQHLLLVDWRRHRLVDLRSRPAIAAYLA